MLTLDQLKPIEQAIQRLSARGVVHAKEYLLSIEATNKQRIEAQQKAEELVSERKKMSQELAQLAKTGKQQEQDEVKKRLEKLKNTYKATLHEQKEAEEALRKQLLQLPNLPWKEVPLGQTPEENVIVKQWGTPRLEEELKPHWELLEHYKLASFSLGNQLAERGFPVFLGRGAALQRALIQWFLQEATQKGYQEVMPPLLASEASALATGQLPDKEGMMYRLKDHPLYLIPTAEVPITNLYRGQIIAQKELPIKHVGYTPCFRREAGSWGKEVRGLNRLHQFDKVELVQVVTPLQAQKALEEMCNHVEELLQSLELPYRILKLCSGDTGHTAAITYDFEVWSAAQSMWLEVSSVSCFDTYQANRMLLRYKDSRGRKELCHTLNGSALALPRVMAALLEHHQTPSGIPIPGVLHRWLSFARIV